MKAVILAAGMASRLRPLTDKCPKCLLSVGSRTLLERTVDSIKAIGINDLTVVTGYREEMIRNFLTNHYPDMKLTFIQNNDYQTTNNILLDSDILFDPAIVARIAQTEGTALAVNTHKLGEEEMKVIAGANGMVTEISKTLDIAKAMGESVGIEKIDAVYSKALYSELEQMIENEKLVDIFYERAFERLIPQGHKFRAVNTTDLFSIELDTVEDFNQANELIPASLI